MAKQNSGEVI